MSESFKVSILDKILKKVYNGYIDEDFLNFWLI